MIKKNKGRWKNFNTHKGQEKIKCEHCGQYRWRKKPDAIEKKSFRVFSKQEIEKYKDSMREFKDGFSRNMLKD